MLKKSYALVCLLAAFLMAAACSNYSGSHYAGREVRSVQVVEFGVVESAQPVTLGEDRDAVLGTALGGVIGGIVGNMFGGGHGRTLATVGGAVLGAAAGYAGEKAVTKQDGLEIMVKLDKGQTISVVQGADETFTAGERVRVLYGSDGSARVSH